MASKEQSREQTRSNSANSPVRRRQHHVRSKKGCATCKERHIRCDERIPFCRNCVRVGRVCVYTTSTTSSRSTTPDQAPGKQMTPLIAHSSTFLVSPGGQRLPNWYIERPLDDNASQSSLPYQGGISSIALAIVQQYYQISTRRSTSPNSPLLMLEDQQLGFTDIAGLHDCVQYALVSFEAYIFDQTTQSTSSKEQFLSNACTALEKLQYEISIFSEGNADTIVTTSIILAGTAQDWEQWVVFIEGYWMALSQIRNNGWQTAYPQLLSEYYQFQRCPPGEDGTSMLWGPEGGIQRRVNEVIHSIQEAASVMAPETWRAIGFKDLEQLGYIVLDAISAQSVSVSYDKLAWLRSWMFWIELRRTNGENEQLALSCYFYALVAAAVPLFPRRYQNSLAQTSSAKMEKLMAGMTEDVVSTFGLSRLLDTVSSQT